MALYVPGTDETDPKKIIMSQQLVAGQTTTNTSNIATNTANIATNTANIAALQASQLAVATQSDQETATSTSTVVTPGRQQFHPSACKAWVSFSSTGTILASYNVSSVSRTATGKFTVTFTTAFSSANYQCSVSSEIQGNSTDACIASVDSTAIPKTASTVSLIFLNAAASAFVNPTVGHLSCFGDQ